MTARIYSPAIPFTNTLGRRPRTDRDTARFVRYLADDFNKSDEFDELAIYTHGRVCARPFCSRGVLYRNYPRRVRLRIFRECFFTRARLKTIRRPV